MIPDMHCKDEIVRDLEGREDFITDEIMLRWFRERYSTSKHLLTLYSIAIGLRPKKIVEIGFGRSSFVLAKAAEETGAKLYCCDRYDYTGYLSDKEKEIITFIHGDGKKAMEIMKGVDFLFLDYFSTIKRSAESIVKEVNKYIPLLKKNGIIAIHDSIEKKYFVRKAMKALRGNVEIMNLPYNYGLALIRCLKNDNGTLEDGWFRK